jgi:hypothetical protein
MFNRCWKLESKQLHIDFSNSKVEVSPPFVSLLVVCLLLPRVNIRKNSKMSSDEGHGSSSNSLDTRRYIREEEKRLTEQVALCTLQPFDEFNTKFNIRVNLAKFLVKDEDIQEHRQGWRNTPWEFSQTKEEEMHERYRAGELIFRIGERLSV